MPNWTTNIITSGNAEVFNKYIKRAQCEYSSETYIDFNAILPMPEELKGITAPVNFTDEETMKADFDKYREWAKGDQKAYPPSVRITTAYSEYLKRKYGADNWYDWNVANWGTKWSARNVIFDPSCKKGLIQSFDTAWSSARGILKELARKEGEELSFITIYEGTGEICEETFGPEGWDSTEQIGNYRYEEDEDGNLVDEPILELYDEYEEYKNLILQYI